MADATLYHLRINPITGNAYMADQGSSPAMPQYVLATDYEALRKRCEAVEARLTTAKIEARDVYRLIPDLPITEDSSEQGTDALTQFCFYFGDLIDDGEDIAAAQEPSHG